MVSRSDDEFDHEELNEHDNIDDHGNDETGNEDATKKLKSVIKRGKTVMRTVIRAKQKGERFVLGWNQKGQVINPNKEIFVSYLGVVTRNKVSIMYTNWRHVPEPLKEQIWEEMQGAFYLENCRKIFTVGEAGLRLRTFRSLLVQAYLKDSNKNWLPNPSMDRPVDYAMIKKEDWVTFVNNCCTEDFQADSAKQRDRAKLQAYPYRKSRKGYAMVEQEMIKDDATQLAVGITRHRLWKHSRIGSDGNPYPKWPKIGITIENIDSLSQNVSQGEISEEGREDVLEKALNKDEHLGRVRGVGFGVTPNDYFPVKAKCGYNHDEKNARLEALERRLDILEAQVLQSQKSHKEEDQISNGKSSHIIPIQQGTRCELSLSNPFRRVANGKMFMDSNTQEYLSVQVVNVWEDEHFSPLPIPREDDGLSVLYDAIGTTVSWPRNLVFLGNSSSLPQRNVDKGKSKSKSPNQQESPIKFRPPKSNPTELKVLWMLANYNLNEGLVVNWDMPFDVFGREYKEYIGLEEIKIVIIQDKIGASVVNSYMWYLNNNHVIPGQLLDRFGFLDSHWCGSGTTVSKKRQSQYLHERFMSKAGIANMTWLLPYNIGKHWVLVVLKPHEEMTFFVDPLHVDIAFRQDMVDMANVAFRVFNAAIGRSSKKFKWSTIKDPRQTNVIDCGYFTLRAMKEIIQHPQIHIIPQNYFSDCQFKMYTQMQLDQIRIEWSNLMMQLITEQFA